MKKPRPKNHHYVVKFLTTEDGDKEIMNRKWHYVTDSAGGNVALCNNQYFGEGESAVEYVDKIGRITCDECRKKIKEFKNIIL